MRKQSLTETISFKLTEPEKEGFTDYCNKRGLSISEGLRELIVDAIELTPDRVDLLSLLKRVEALEAIVEPNRSRQKPPPKRTIKPDTDTNSGKNPEEFGDLLTNEDISKLTGYALGSLGRQKSVRGLEAVKRVDGNRKGLYRKEDVLDKFSDKIDLK